MNKDQMRTCLEKKFLLGKFVLYNSYLLFQMQQTLKFAKINRQKY